MGSVIANPAAIVLIAETFAGTPSSLIGSACSCTSSSSLVISSASRLLLCFFSFRFIGGLLLSSACATLTVSAKVIFTCLVAKEASSSALAATISSAILLRNLQRRSWWCLFSIFARTRLSNIRDSINPRMRVRIVEWPNTCRLNSCGSRRRSDMPMPKMTVISMARYMPMYTEMRALYLSPKSKSICRPLSHVWMFMGSSRGSSGSRLAWML
mmetsp:Transcript_47450/g.140162  ORF Transcript_47450/g.140162 Transcript_47450/m.140162 type:complete len:213 (-) Transcript_47450:566-1204(-)